MQMIKTKEKEAAALEIIFQEFEEFLLENNQPHIRFRNSNEGEVNLESNGSRSDLDETQGNLKQF